MPLELIECNRYVLIEKLAKQGMTLKQVSEIFEVTPATVAYWMEKDEQFREAWQKGRLHPDYQVEQALFKRAVGFKAQEITEEHDAGGKLLKRKIVTKDYLPSEIACIFWLKNRLPDLWKDRVEHNITLADMMALGQQNGGALPNQTTKALPETVIEAEVVPNESD